MELKIKGVSPTQAYAPATVGNLVVGFDVLGLAIQPLDGSLLGDIVSVSDASGSKKGVEFRVEGPHQGDLSSDPKSNLVYQLAFRFMEAAEKGGKPCGAISIVLEKNLPICSGLGSSGSSAVAALVALNAHHENPLNKEALLNLAGYGEEIASGSPHLDNVAPSLYGGVCLLRQDAKAGVIQLPWPDVLAFRRIVNGVFPSTQPWLGETLPQQP